MSSFSERKYASAPAYVSEIGIVGGTSSMAAVRAKQMARQREISSASARKMRSDGYLRNLYEEEDREKQEEKERARAREFKLEEQRIEQLAAKADRVRLRTEGDPSFADRKPIIEESGPSAYAYSVQKARRREEQMRRASNDRREEVSKDLARARALLQEERKKDSLELARDMAKGYGPQPTRRSGYREQNHRREPVGSILKTTNRRRFDFDLDDYASPRSRVPEERFSDSAYGRTNGIHRDIGSSSLRSGSSRLSKEVHWTDD